MAQRSEAPLVLSSDQRNISAQNDKIILFAIPPTTFRPKTMSRLLMAVHYFLANKIIYNQERPLGQWKTPPANKLVHDVTSRLKLSTTRKFLVVLGTTHHVLVCSVGTIFTIYRSSTTQYLNDFDFEPLRSLKVKSNGSIRLPIYDFLLM